MSLLWFYCSRLEGQLSKWTNALKGWQPRWLSVDQQQGVLHYYTVSEGTVGGGRGEQQGVLHYYTVSEGTVGGGRGEQQGVLHYYTVSGAQGEGGGGRGEGGATGGPPLLHCE